MPLSNYLDNSLIDKVLSSQEARTHSRQGTPPTRPQPRQTHAPRQAPQQAPQQAPPNRDNQTKVPPLKLNLLKQSDSNSSQYHVTRGVDTSRSVLSWGDDSYRDARNQGAGATNTRPHGVDKIDTRAVGGRKEGNLVEKENRDISHRVGTSFFF